MESSAWLAITIAVPLGAALLCFLAPKFGRLIAAAALALTGVAVVKCALLLAETGAVGQEVGGWGRPLGIDLYLDGAALLCLAVTWVVGLAVSVYAGAYFRGSDRAEHFRALWMFLWAGLNALFLSRDIFNLYVTLEVIGLAAVALVALPGRTEALTAAMRYLLVSLLGSMCYLLGVALLYAEYSTVDQVLLAERIGASPSTHVAIAVMSGGLLMKAALFPLHFWLPPAHANAPAPVSALLSALVVKGSLFIMIRLWTGVFADVIPASAVQIVGVLAAGAIFWGSIQALIQTRLKMLVAYSTVAQLGYLFLIFPLFAAEEPALAAWTGCFYFLASHACAKTAMFLAAGNLLYAAGDDRLSKVGAFAAGSPLSIAAFAMAGVSIVGLPPSGGFLGKWLLLNAALGEGQWWWVAVIALGGLLAAAYVLRVLAAAFLENDPEPLPRKAPAAMEWTAFAMGLIAILLGLFSELPLELIGIDSPAAGPLLKGGVQP